jgi:hypothetical protein
MSIQYLEIDLGPYVSGDGAVWTGGRTGLSEMTGVTGDITGDVTEDHMENEVVEPANETLPKGQTAAGGHMMGETDVTGDR